MGAPDIYSPTDEITFTAVEVKNATRVSSLFIDYLQRLQDPLAPGADLARRQVITSRAVTTSGAAVLIAWWWGDGAGGLEHRAIPNNDFTVLGSALSMGDFVQFCFAYKQVDQAGTYDVSWDMLASEGAILWIAAIE